MFANAYKIASAFTRPVIVSTRFFDKTVESGCGAYIIVNNQGWIITVAHLWNSHFTYKQHGTEISVYKQQVDSILQAKDLRERDKQRKIKRLTTNPKWITDCAYWWGNDTMQLKDIHPFPELDLVIGRLDPFNPTEITGYPVFKDPSNINTGTSLCKLGFPFHSIDATFDEASNSFKLAPNALPLPLFPIEGIFTRNIMAGRTRDNKYDIKFLETSSPGLRGQSGGPIFDINGTVWAIQSRTRNFPLGFSPKLVKNGQEVEENQFLNVGWGCHPESIISVLKDVGVTFNVSDY